METNMFPAAMAIFLNIGGGEVILIALILLFCGRNIPDIARRLGVGILTGWREFLAAREEIVSLLFGDKNPDVGLKQFVTDSIKGQEPGSVALDYAAGHEERWWIKPEMSIKLFIAQGFGVGRIPFAPGTFGSLLGLVWFAILLLLANGNLLAFLFGCFAGVGVSVWLCGVAEKILKQKDPGSVVLDEIIAVPLCFLGWLGVEFIQTGRLPTFGEVFRFENAALLAAGFLVFRFFDIVKPWPVRQSQWLLGGWGVTIDDVLAAGYVNLVWLLFFAAQKIGGL